jgi:hypothetical protein
MAHAVSLAVPRGRAWGTTEIPLGNVCPVRLERAAASPDLISGHGRKCSFGH